MERIVEEIPAGEVFGLAEITETVNRRFRGPPKAADSRVISTILRRMAAAGTIRRAQKGTSHRQAAYSRE